jgi:hypothetical protein
MSDCIRWASNEMSPREVKQRRADARRNGYAAWLWPDVDIGHWRAAVGEIVSVTRKVMAGETGPELVCDDARAMCIAAYTSGMGPLLGFWIENGAVRAPSETGELLHMHLVRNRQRMARLSAILKRIIESLNNANIVPVVLKGMDTAARYFPEPGVRPLSDFDIFVPVESIPRAEQILSGLGYERVARTRAPYACDWVDPLASRWPRTLTMVHENDPWSIDLLGSLDKRLPTGARIGFDGLVSRTRLTSWDAGGHAEVMPQPLLALYLAVHFCQTFLNVTVLRALELALVIRRDSKSGTFDWNEFVRGADTLGGIRYIYPALIFVEQLAPGSVPGAVVEAAMCAAPTNLRTILADLTLAGAQPLDRHSVRERFMWASDWREIFFQIASELSFDGRGVPGRVAAYSIGTKLWALRRGRYST